MPPRTKAQQRRQQGSLTSFDAFKISKPLPKTHLKDTKQLLHNKKTVEDDPAPIALLEKEDSVTEELKTETVTLPQLDESDPEYLGAAAAIKQAKKTPVIHTNPTTIEIILRDFDLTGKYGPCAGITRLARYNRAIALKMDPPSEVGKILVTQQAEENSEYKNDLFYGRL